MARIANRQSHLPYLDALRGWAILAVVLVHSGQGAVENGFIYQVSAFGQYGVQLFFIVSAITISMTYDAHVSRSGFGPRLAVPWLTKRFFRIAPIYYIGIVFYPIEQYAIFAATHHQQGSVATQAEILANVFFLHAFDPNIAVVPGGWSIGIEMLFYCLVPLIWMLNERARVVALVIGAAASIATAFVAHHWVTHVWRIDDDTFFYHWFPTQLPVFAIGLIYYLVAVRRGGIHHRLGFAFIAAGLCALGLICGTNLELAPALAPTIMGLAFVFLIPGLTGSLAKIVVNPFAIFFGQISYSVYIVHFFILDIARAGLKILDRGGADIGWTFPLVFAGTLAASGALALLSKRFIEDPWIERGRRASDGLVLRLKGAAVAKA